MWFDVAVVMSIFAVGNILFGHFEEHRPKARRLLKVALLLGLTVALSAAGLRWVAYSLLGALGLAAAYVHLWWLPSHGINGLTGEPKAKYYELIGVRRGIDLERGFEQVDAYWSPKVIGRVNDQYVKLAKVKGELTWHKHDGEDELFLVARGRLRLQFEDDEVQLGEGEMYVVPKGVMHNPVADEECWIVLIETVTTRHTGDVETPLTKSIAEQLG